MSSVQWEVYQKYFDNRKDEGNYFDTIGLQVCNLVCTEKVDLKQKDMTSMDDFYGTQGFKSIIDVDAKKNSLHLSFKNERVKDLFQYENIHHISAKFKKIIEGLERSKGICFIYSQFLWSGIYPLAIL